MNDHFGEGDKSIPIDTGEFLYLKEEGDSHLGTGTIWIEFTGDFATRQCERYGKLWVYSLEESAPGIGGEICVGRLSEMDFEPASVISRDEFEKTWEQALQHYKNWPDIDPNISRYFKVRFEEKDEPGIVYLEFHDQWATRQCYRLLGSWKCSHYNGLPPASPL